ncbi:MAG: alpha/beta hydrolase [Chlamydiales bacterium]
MVAENLIEVGKQKIWTEVVGYPSDCPILLMTGAGSHAHFWSDFFCEFFLKAGFYLIRYDHRDTGLSDPSEDGYELRDLVEDAIGILNHYNISSAHVIGHSMGGYIGQLMAFLYPDRMKSLTVIATGPVGETETIIKPHTREEQEVIHTTCLAMIRNRPTSNFEESYEGFRTVWERLNGTAPLDEELARAYTEEMFTRSKYPLGANHHHVKVMQKIAETLKERREIFSSITLPTLIIHGEEDYLVLVERGGKALKEKLPHAKWALIPKMGHMFFNYSIQELLSKGIISFLQGIN